MAEYKTYRNYLNALIKNTKNDYYRSKINTNSNDIKKIYAIINEATNTSKGKNVLSKILTHNDQTLSDPKELSNYINEYYTNVDGKMNDALGTPSNPFKPQNNCPFSMYLKPTNCNEIIKHINSLKNGCSSGFDAISSRSLKILHLHLLDPLVHIINLIFRTGRVPEKIKLSVVTPIFKSGNREKIENYRHISNIAKIFKKCLKDRLLGYFTSHHLLSENQYGFRPGQGTSNAMYELASEINGNLDGGNKCIALFLDLAKAFDTVSHHTLLQILEGCGVRGTVLELFSSYLSDRTQYVRIATTLSEPKRIEYGVPQGTVIGPILFNIYINDLCNLDVDGRIISYADDTAVIFSGSTWDLAKNKFLRSFKKIKDLLNSLGLTLNVEKTKYIAFSITMKNRPAFNNIRIDNNGNNIDGVDSMRYLGILIDKHLKWNEHVLYLSQKMRFLIYKFFILRNILTRKTIIMVYRAIAESLFRYGILVWGGMYNTNLAQLKTIQNYIVKTVLNKPKLYSTSLLYSRDICNLQTLYITSICNFVHVSDGPGLDLLNHGYSTRGRSNLLLNVPKSRRDINQRFLTYLAPKMYNLIPLDIRRVEQPKKFSKLFIEYFFSNPEPFLTILG